MKLQKIVILMAMVCVLCSCAPSETGVSPLPPTPSPFPVPTPVENKWQKISDYYHKYIIGLAAPIGATAAMVIAPESAPLIALAARGANDLDKLIAAKANDSSIEATASAVQSLIIQVNQMVGEAKNGR